MLVLVTVPVSTDEKCTGARAGRLCDVGQEDSLAPVAVLLSDVDVHNATMNTTLTVTIWTDLSRMRSSSTEEESESLARRKLTCFFAGKGGVDDCDVELFRVEKVVDS